MIIDLKNVETYSLNCSECSAPCCREFYIPIFESDVDKIQLKTGLEKDDIYDPWTDIKFKISENSLNSLKLIGTIGILKKRSNNDCIFLKNKLCSVYEIRPNSCRFFPLLLTDIKKNLIKVDLESFALEKCNLYDIENGSKFTEQQVLLHYESLNGIIDELTVKSLF